MKTEKLQFHLPPESIAQQPLHTRSGSKLLVFNRSTGKIIDTHFSKIGDFLKPGDCLVLNDTKVLPARFFAHRASGANLEVLFLTENKPGLWEIMLKNARKVKNNETIYLKDKGKNNFCTAEVLKKTANGKCLLKINKKTKLKTILDKIGFPPLPPYIKRNRNLKQAAIDKKRYQTVYANHPGAIAAPTAGLHFTNKLIKQLNSSQIQFAYLTLHVGLGTFKPITTETLEKHKMHQEQFSIDTENARIINSAKQKGGRIIAVGTTSIRALETVAEGPLIKAVSDSTKLFIRPGYKFKIVDAMITNFHLPKSTLLALVAAFAGLENILAAYNHAVKKQYRFYSYGDAMLII